MDEKFTVLVQNLLPGFQLTMHALHQCEDGHSWEAFAHYTADATSIVNGKTITIQEDEFRTITKVCEWQQNIFCY